MSNESSSGNVREYVAFISYRHKELDKKIAKQVHTMVERYVIPKEMRDAQGTKKLGHVFRDEEELPVSSNLTESIQTALDHSKFLIVICTPNTPESLWVEREIEYFISHHDRDHVVGILVDGTPEMSFPALLTKICEVNADGEVSVREIEPLAANLTNEEHKYTASRMKKEAVRLYAALLGCPFDSLWQRERRQKMRKLVAVMALGMTVALAFCISIYLKNLEINARNKQIEEQNEQIQAQNQEITSQNEEIKNQYQQIEERNSQLRKSEAYTLLREGELLYERGDMNGAVDRALQSVDTQEGMEAYASDAEYLLFRALGAGRHENHMRTVAVIEQKDDVREMLFSKDGTWLYALGSQGFVNCYSTEDGKLCWKANTHSIDYHYYVAKRDRLQLLEEQGLLLCFEEDVITAMRLSDGSEAYCLKLNEHVESDFALLSPDRKKIIYMDEDGSYFDWTSHLTIADAATGKELQRIELPEEISHLDLQASGNKTGAISEDGRYLGMMIYEGMGWSSYDKEYVVVVDLQEGTTKILRSRELSYFRNYSLGIPFTIGVVCHADTQSMIVMHYYADGQCVSMEEFFFDGRVGETSEVAMVVPDREVTEPYVSTFEPGDNNGILASCCDMTFLYLQDTGKLLDNGKYSSANVLKSHWIDHREVAYAYLSADGFQNAIFSTKGMSLGEITDKIHMSKMILTDDYAIYDGDAGFKLKEAAVEAVICDDNPRKIYLQRPARDDEVEAADWILDRNETVVNVTIQSVGEERLAMMAERVDGSAYVKIINAVTRETEKTYEINLSAEDNDQVYGARYLVGDSVVWPDGRHLTYSSFMNQYQLDFDTMKLTRTFGDYNVKESSMAVTAQGEVLHAAITRDESSSYGNDKYALVIKLNDGEITKWACPEGESWRHNNDYVGDLKVLAGENGYVLVAIYENPDEDLIGDYRVFNAATGKSDVLHCQVKMGQSGIVTMGKKTPRIVTASEDNVIRIYDLDKLCLERKIVMDDGSKINQVEFGSSDQALVVWTAERRLLIYDLSDGQLKYEGYVESDESYAGSVLTLETFDDVQRNRLFCRLSSGASICVNLKDWKKTADFDGLGAFCPKMNEIYVKLSGSDSWAMGGAAFVSRKAYTLEDLMEKAKE